MHQYRRRLTAVLVSLFLAAAAAAAPSIAFRHSGGTLRVAVVGDAGLQTATISRALEAVRPLDAILLVGDNFYPCGVRSASDPKWSVVTPLTRLGIPIWAVLGNHDHCGNVDAQVGADVPNWVMPAREYAVSTDVATFAILDTTPLARGRSSAAFDFLRETFAGAKGTWRIAVGHHVVVSSGWHSLFPRAEARNMRRLLPVLRETEADLYVCGHDHHEELLGGRPMLLVSGAGSDPVPMVMVRDETIWPRTTHFREPIGFALLEITRESLTVEFHDARGRATSGRFQVERRR